MRLREAVIDAASERIDINTHDLPSVIKLSIFLIALIATYLISLLLYDVISSGLSTPSEYTSVMSLLSTLLLVLLTGWYSYNTQKMVKESHHDRMRPAALEFIAHSIDPILEQIYSHNQKMMGRIYPGRYQLPHLQPLDIPDQEFVDIQREDRKLAEEIREYQQLSKSYYNLWMDVKDELAQELMDEISITARAPDYAKYVLELRDSIENESHPKGMREEWVEERGEFFKLRDSEGISQRIQKLKNISHRMEMKASDIEDDLRSVRESHRTKHEILETEIRLKRDE